LEPVEWTDDGWFKTPDGIKISQPIQRPYENIDSSDFSLDDDFKGDSLSFQWKFFGEYDTTMLLLYDLHQYN